MFSRLAIALLPLCVDGFAAPLISRPRTAAVIAQRPALAVHMSAADAVPMPAVPETQVERPARLRKLAIRTVTTLSLSLLVGPAIALASGGEHIHTGQKVRAAHVEYM